MGFIPALKAAQDRNRVFDSRFVNIDRHESPSQSRVAFDIFAILIQRRRAKAVQFAARERWLDQIGRIHRAIRLAGSDQRVHLIDKEHDAAFSLFNFF